MSLTENLASVQARLDAALAAAGRPPGSAQLAVTLRRVKWRVRCVSWVATYWQ